MYECFLSPVPSQMRVSLIGSDPYPLSLTDNSGDVETLVTWYYNCRIKASDTSLPVSDTHCLWNSANCIRNAWRAYPRFSHTCWVRCTPRELSLTVTASCLCRPPNSSRFEQRCDLMFCFTDRWKRVVIPGYSCYARVNELHVLIRYKSSVAAILEVTFAWAYF